MHTLTHVDVQSIPQTLASLDLQIERVWYVRRVNDGRRLIIKLTDGSELRVYDLDNH